MRKMKRILIMLLVVCALVTGLSPTAYAKPRVIRVYRDVTARKVDAKSLDAISFVKGFGGWNSLIKKGKFFPNKYMTRREFLVVLHNLYGGYVTASIDDVIKSDEIVTSDFVCQRMVELSRKLGYSITWSGSAEKMRRKDVARYIKIFATYHPNLMPRKP